MTLGFPFDVIAIAREQANAAPAGGRRDSAFVCLRDAEALATDKNDFAVAARRAQKSLGYSVGIFHPAYKQATRAIEMQTRD